ncbi:hypothetical protein E2C01_043682 [Portunus trituberculatus]|uniref:Uncharacterized protein n=1 Tax=Portunus trituberculatus TaxID=210409 RepID=A0A5B7FY84_PORTR|nr:hypothetical protein [Portunus trituberculatus]
MTGLHSKGLSQDGADSVGKALNATFGVWASCISHLPGARRDVPAQRTPEAHRTEMPLAVAQGMLNSYGEQEGEVEARPGDHCPPEREGEVGAFCPSIPFPPPLFWRKWTHPPPSVSPQSSRSSVILVTFTRASTSHKHKNGTTGAHNEHITSTFTTSTP